MTDPATNITGTSFQANWQPAAGAISYEVQVTLVTTQVTSATSAVITGLSSGREYAYRVRAYNTNSQLYSDWSPPRSVSTLAPPNAPTGFQMHPFTGTTCHAQWNVLANADYELLISSDPNFNSNPRTISTAATSIRVIGLTPGTTYYGKVRARVGGVFGDYSDRDSGSTTPAPAGPTTNPASGITAASFNARWNRVENATHYRIDVSASPEFASYVGPFWDLDVGNALQVIVPDLSASTTYYYRVRAWNGDAGPSANSDVRRVTTASAPQIPPSAPATLPASSVGMTSFVANWNAVATATGYRIDVAPDPAFMSFVPGYRDLDAGNNTSHPVVGLTAGGTFYYRVRAANAAGPSGHSDTRTVVLQQNPAPTLSRISPAFAMAGVASVTVTLVGTNFLADSVAQRNGNDLPTTWRSATQLEARIEGSLLATLGSASITVFNAPPGGGTSSAKTFLVIDPTTGLPPTDLRIMSPSPGPDLLLAWAPPPDIAAANGYRLRRYATPYRNTVPLERDLPNTAVTAQVPLILGTSYFDLVVVRGAGVQSLPTRLVKVSTTTNHAAGDVNGDNLVDGRDLMDVLAAFGSHAGETEWNPSADCNGDGVVNGDDVVRVTINLGSRQ